jgi:hypothetical protein
MGSSGFVPPQGTLPEWPTPPIASPVAPPTAPAVNRLRNVPTLGLLMMVHGGLILLWVAFCVFAIVIGFLNVGFVSSGSGEDWLVIVLYSVFAVGALPAAVLGLLAGVRVRKLESRKLAIAALIVGGTSFFCGNVFCMPFTVGLLIYGIMVLTDSGVSAAFARVRAGEPAEAVFRDAGVAR